MHLSRDPYDAAMLTSVTPSTIGAVVVRPCWHCTYFAGLDASGSHSWCQLTGSARVQALPATGCAFWLREPGSDDEPVGEVPAFAEFKCDQTQRLPS